jgi:hypothetical protein
MITATVSLERAMPKPMKSPTSFRLFRVWQRYKARFEQAFEDQNMSLAACQRAERRYTTLDFRLYEAPPGSGAFDEFDGSS